MINWPDLTFPPLNLWNIFKTNPKSVDVPTVQSTSRRTTIDGKKILETIEQLHKCR